MRRILARRRRAPLSDSVTACDDAAARAEEAATSRNTGIRTRPVKWVLAGNRSRGPFEASLMRNER